MSLIIYYPYFVPMSFCATPIIFTVTVTFLVSPEFTPALIHSLKPVTDIQFSFILSPACLPVFLIPLRSLIYRRQ